LGQVIGLCVANVPCPNCGGDKTPQRANSPTGVFRSPSRRTGGVAVTVCYVKYGRTLLFT